MEFSRRHVLDECTNLSWRNAVRKVPEQNLSYLMVFFHFSIFLGDWKRVQGSGSNKCHRASGWGISQWASSRSPGTQRWVWEWLSWSHPSLGSCTGCTQHSQGMCSVASATVYLPNMATEVNNLFVFLPNSVIFDYFMAEKHPNLGNWTYDYLVKNWATLKSLAADKKRQFAAVWCSEVLATLGMWMWSPWWCYQL